MGFLANLLARAEKTVTSYSGDSAFLHGVAAAAANVTAADGQIDDSEIDAAISGMQANPIVSASYSASQIEDALTNALRHAKTRAGRMENKRAIEALMSRPSDLRQDVFLIAADVADDGGIGAEERKVLDEIANALNLDAKKLLGE